eukprot:m51a1_g12414 putative m-phase inducer phosphatase 3 (273) ;mRNA; r:731891-732802
MSGWQRSAATAEGRGLPRPSQAALDPCAAAPCASERPRAESIVPTIQERGHSSVRKLHPHTLAMLLSGHFRDAVDAVVVVDCRYPYEYDGGHIRGAVNVPGDSDVAKALREMFFGGRARSGHAREALVFHCEFSQKRAPEAIRILRGLDRAANYPSTEALCYPHVFLLSGGYKEFFALHKELCEPAAYVPMESTKHIEEQRLCLRQRREIKSLSSALGGARRSAEETPLIRKRARRADPASQCPSSCALAALYPHEAESESEADKENASVNQ